MIIDSHVHLWSLDRPECSWPTHAEKPLHRDFGIDDLKPILSRNAVGAAILVQSQEHADDTAWLLSIAAGEPLIAGVVGWCDLLDEEAPARIADLAAKPKAVGVRPMVQHCAAEWFDRPRLDPAFRSILTNNFVLDALIRIRHLPALNRLAIRYPDMRIVIDHAAKPTVGSKQAFDHWRATIAPLADAANVTCKVSGLLTECDDAPPDAVAPYISELLALFGADRLMWGSDWPVLTMADDYESWLDLAKSCVPTKDHDRIFHQTASNVYGLAQ